MDFKKEYEKFLSSGAEAVLDDFDKQKQELEKKSYMIHVLNVLKEVEEHRKNIPKDIVYLVIKRDFDYDLGYEIKVSFLDKDKKEIKYLEEENPNDTEDNYFVIPANPIEDNSEYVNNNEMVKIEEVLHFFHETELISPLLKAKEQVAVKNDESLVENLFNLFLNDELKSIIKSVQLDRDLLDKTSTSKKLKV